MTFDRYCKKYLQVYLTFYELQPRSSRRISLQLGMGCEWECMRKLSVGSSRAIDYQDHSLTMTGLSPLIDNYDVSGCSPQCPPWEMSLDVRWLMMAMTIETLRTHTQGSQYLSSDQNSHFLHAGIIFSAENSWIQINSNGNYILQKTFKVKPNQWTS